MVPFLDTSKAEAMPAGEVAVGSLAVAHGALHLRIKFGCELFGTTPLRWYLRPLQTYFLTTAAGAAVALLLGCLVTVLLPIEGGYKTENEGDREWVNLLKVHHLLLVNKLFFGKVGNEHFCAST